MKTHRFEILPSKEQMKLLNIWANDCRRMLNYVSKVEYGEFKKANSQINIGKKYATKDSDKNLSKRLKKDYKMRHLYGALNKFSASIKPPQYDDPFIVSTSQVGNKITKEGGKYYFSYNSHVNKGDAQTLSIKSVDKKGRERKDILDIFVEKEGAFTFEVHKLKHTKRPDSWILYLIDSSPLYQPKEDYSTIMGIDMGIKRPATVIVRDLEGKLVWRQFYKEKLMGRSKNYVTNYLHNISKEIVDKAKQLNAVIVIEGLKFQSKKRRIYAGKGDRAEITRRRILSKWAFGELTKMLIYKSEYEGVILQKVNPKYTSQTCPKCRERTKIDREVEKRFVCEYCKGDYDFDFVGAWNISGLILPDSSNA